MASNKDIKRRIKSVKNIGQITKALQTVSAVKMRKAQEAMHSSVPFYEKMQAMFQDVLIDVGEEEIAEYMRKTNKKEKNNVGLIIISPSKGFAGSLLSNLAKKTLDFIEKREKNHIYENDEFILFHEEQNPLNQDQKIEIKVVTVEKKSKDFALHLNKEIIADFPKLSSPATFDDVVPIVSIMLESYEKGDIDEVYVVYTHFLTTFSQKAVVKKLLPFDFSAYMNKQTSQKKWYTYSDAAASLFADLYPAFLEATMFQCVLDAAAAEHTARMIAMKNATDNAKDLQKDLVFAYNQNRQASITQEIAEITSAADTI